MEWLKFVRWKKNIFFLSDNDISAAILPNRETWVGDFGAKLSPKVFCSATIKSNQFMSPWRPMKCSSSSGTITCNFWNWKRLSVDASRNDAQGEQMVVFEFELAFLQVRLQLLFYFIVLMGIVASVIGMSFFAAAFQILDWSFLVLHFYGNVCNWIPKVIWPRMDWFWGFLLKNGFFHWLHICVEWNLQEMLNCYSFLTTSNFFDV